MLRQIIKIAHEKCNGCGLCVSACHERAIALVDGKARLLRDDYCDGLGNCLPVCPANAITLEERDALQYSEMEVMKNLQQNVPCGCPGGNAKITHPNLETIPQPYISAVTQLKQWPVQIKLVPLTAPYFENAELLIAADCSAYAYEGFHHEFMRNKVTLIGCPKLDGVDYSEKLCAVIKSNKIRSVSIVRIEVPCCGELERAVKQALVNSNKVLPCQVVIISTDGRIISA